MNQKNEKGITLIALVITIIVLLILAGVTINMVLGDDGIIGQAQNAKTITEEKEKDEEFARHELEDVVANYLVEDSFAKKITPENYGNIVNGYSVNEVSEWQIFSKEGNNVWLISKNYVQVDAETASKAGLAVNGLYVGWDTTKIPEEYKSNSQKWNAEQLANTSNWRKYVDTTKAVKAMGGPTIEMFVNSYNAKNPTKTIMYRTNTAGYQLKWSTDADTSYSHMLNGKITDDEGLYHLTGPASAYWLASPAHETIASCVLQVSSSGEIHGNAGFGETNYGIRPVVCLRADVKVESDEAGTTWTLQVDE